MTHRAHITNSNILRRNELCRKFDPIHFNSTEALIPATFLSTRGLVPQHSPQLPRPARDERNSAKRSTRTQHQTRSSHPEPLFWNTADTEKRSQRWPRRRDCCDLIYPAATPYANRSCPRHRKRPSPAVGSTRSQLWNLLLTTINGHSHLQTADGELGLGLCWCAGRVQNVNLTTLSKRRSTYKSTMTMGACELLYEPHGIVGSCSRARVLQATYADAAKGRGLSRT